VKLMKITQPKAYKGQDNIDIFNKWVNQVLHWFRIYKVTGPAVKSRSTPVGGPVKSRRRRTKEEGRGLDKRLVQLELETTWIQQLRTTSIDPLHRFWSRGGVEVRDRDGQEQE